MTGLPERPKTFPILQRYTTDNTATAEKPLGPLAFSEILQERTNFTSSVMYSGTVRVKVIRNPFARSPLPTNVFRGPFDQHWEIDKAPGWFSLMWIGEELNRLRARACPGPLWLL